jgi:hypothetical protein
VAAFCLAPRYRSLRIPFLVRLDTFPIIVEHRALEVLGNHRRQFSAKQVGLGDASQQRADEKLTAFVELESVFIDWESRRL